MLHLLKKGNQPSGFLKNSEQYFDCVIKEIEKLQIYPRLNSYRDLVLLALLDKVVTTGRAVIRLVGEGFADQAFGLSRTAIEAFFALKYIENKDSEARAKRYLEYFGKDREHLTTLIAKHHPHLSTARPPDYGQLMNMAKQFNSPHKWYPESSLKEVAYEKSTWALDNNGQPQSWEYTYDIVYKFTSHEVHATSVALELRIAGFLENSRYPSAFRFTGPTSDSDGDNALVNACVHCHAAIDYFFHGFDVEVPPTIRTQFEEWQKGVGLSSAPATPISTTP